MNKFQESALLIPGEYRCIQSSPGRWNLPLEHCFFGVPQSAFFGWTVLNSIPKKLKGVHFYLGGEPVKLVSDFADSEYPQGIEKLVIGNSSYAIGKHLNYTDLISKISRTKFPFLKILELGVWQLFCNAHCMYGKLGDVTKILKNSPKIEQLGLYGYFELKETINFDFLKNITVTLDDYITGSNGGFISQLTLCKLLESDFPCLENAFFDLTCEENEYGYKFPEKFLEGTNMPNLKKLEITGGFFPGEKERLLKSPLGTKLDVIYHLEDMTVS